MLPLCTGCVEAHFREVRNRNIGVQARAPAPGGPVLEISVESCKEGLEAKIHGAVFMRECEASGRAALVARC